MDAWAKPTGNLSANQCARGLRFGVVALGVALLAAATLASLGTPWVWRLALFVPFYVAANGFSRGLFGL